MFEPNENPRVFAVPLGVSFAAALKEGVMARLATASPEAVARVEIIVNTSRMRRQLQSEFQQGPAGFTPRIRVLSDLGEAPEEEPASQLAKRLQLSQLVGGLIDQNPELAPRGSRFDLAQSLANLMDELDLEDVPLDAIRNLDIADQSGHWARSLQFLNIAGTYWESLREQGGAARSSIETLIASWATHPPTHPILVAGSTGSRGAMRQLMEAVSILPQGAVVLPGFDDLAPRDVLMMPPAKMGQDHPQYRLYDFCTGLGLAPADIPIWADQAARPRARVAFTSLALCPAPVTDLWVAEGPRFEDLNEVTESVTYLKAMSSREEAVAIAFGMREALERDKKVALVTPDRHLTRQVTAALRRYGITPDDSAGAPLHLSAPGRLLRHITGLFGRNLTSEDLMVLLKHPLVHSGGEGRGVHLLWARSLEIYLRRKAVIEVDVSVIEAWAKSDETSAPWVAWVAQIMAMLADVPVDAPDTILEAHVTIAEHLSAGMAGSQGDACGLLWQKAEGEKAKSVLRDLSDVISHAGVLSFYDYAKLIDHVLTVELRDPVQSDPRVLILGTLEARVQTADLVILAGLNEGIWPQSPSPDPWLNRMMRKAAGLLLPERRIGLAAHDFQQALAAKEVWISRSVRDAEAETVPSRWVARIENLMSGLVENGGQDALDAMIARGTYWRSLARFADEPEDRQSPAKRPSPKPPVAARPRALSVTQIEKLVRDPYAIYASKVLGLSPLDPLRKNTDMRLRGTLVHEVFERFVAGGVAPDAVRAKEELLEITDQILTRDVPSPSTRIFWRSWIAEIADWFIAGEYKRQEEAALIAFEQEGGRGVHHRASIDFTLSALADRIDMTDAGEAYIYDYKSGKPPTEKQQMYYNKQLLLEAAMLEDGAFSALGARPVKRAQYIGFAEGGKIVDAPLDVLSTAEIWKEFDTLIARYDELDQGYTSKRAMEDLSYSYDFDHLARFGEWDISDETDPQKVGS
ncbi:MAG: double-strand break repair protein AddB [Halocynthiibacter sp.]